MLSVLLLPLLGGYLYCRKSEQYRYSLIRRSGYDLFFTAAVAGALLWAASALPIGLAILAALWFTGHTLLPLPYEVTGFAACFFAFGLGYPVALIHNKRIDKGEKIEREVLEEGDRLELLLHKSLKEHRKPLLITLDSRKVYLGRVTKSLDPYGNRTYFSILKLRSGYRTRKGNVIFQTYYEDVLDKLWEGELPELSLDDFHVLVSKNRVLYAAVFHPEAKKVIDETEPPD